MLSLTCTVLYSRHHPRVSRLHAGLKWAGISFIALTADLETVLQLSSSSFCLQSDVALISCLTITSAGIVVCTLSGPREGTDCGFLYKNYFHLQQQLEAKSELLLLCTCVVVGAGFDNDLWTNRCPLLERNPEC